MSKYGSIDSYLSLKAENELVGQLFFFVGNPESFSEAKPFDLYEDYSLHDAHLIRFSDNIFLLFSYGDIKQIKRKINSLISCHYPSLSRFNLSSDSLIDFFNSFIENSASVFVRRAVYKSHIRVNLKYEIRTHIDYPKQELTSFVSELDGTSNQVVSFDVSVFYNSIKSMIHIGSDGYLKIKRNFSMVSNYLLEYLSKRYRNIIFPLSDRFRRAADNYKIKPIVLRFNSDLFGTSERLMLLINVIMELNNVSLSTYSSNPYFYGDLLDYADGSSASIKVSNPREILIIPQLECNAAFLDKIIAHLVNHLSSAIIEYC